MAITRTHFAYRIDLWTDDEKEVVEHLADVDDLTVALATYHAAIERWPGKAITLRQGRHVIEDSRRSRLATLFSFPWSDKPPPERAGQDTAGPGRRVQSDLTDLLGLSDWRASRRNMRRMASTDAAAVIRGDGDAPIQRW